MDLPDGPAPPTEEHDLRPHATDENWICISCEEATESERPSVPVRRLFGVADARPFPVGRTEPSGAASCAVVAGAMARARLFSSPPPPSDSDADTSTRYCRRTARLAERRIAASLSGDTNPSTGLLEIRRRIRSGVAGCLPDDATPSVDAAEVPTSRTLTEALLTRRRRLYELKRQNVRAARVMDGDGASPATPPHSRVSPPGRRTRSPTCHAACPKHGSESSKDHFMQVVSTSFGTDPDSLAAGKEIWDSSAKNVHWSWLFENIWPELRKVYKAWDIRARVSAEKSPFSYIAHCIEVGEKLTNPDGDALFSKPLAPSPTPCPQFDIKSSEFDVNLQVPREGTAYDRLRRKKKEKKGSDGLLLPPLLEQLVYVFETLEELRARLWEDKGVALRYPRCWIELSALQARFRIWRRRSDFVCLLQQLAYLELMADDFHLALDHRGHVFSDDLVYTRQLPESSNDARLEKGTFKFRDRDMAVYEISKAFTRCAVYSPLLFLWDDKVGAYLATSTRLRKRTIVAEYSGVVEPLRWSCTRAENRCDSIYELLTPGDSELALSVVPETHTNIARFIAGINDSKKRSAGRVNLYPQRNNIDGEMHILISTRKDIEQRAALWMNYNAGGKNYPTEDFE